MKGKLMNLVSFSIRTKGMHNFARRIATVVTRFGFSETRMRRAIHTVLDSLRGYNAAPTFFIPAVVLHRHPALIAEVARGGAEIDVHGYVHNDYRSLSKSEQYKQTKQAIAVFQKTHIPCRGFRNPYLGWTEEALHAFAALGLSYESNEAVLHNAIDLGRLSPYLRSGYEKSLTLYRVLPCTPYTLRPHFEGPLLRIPISIPDDEMLFDRLRITDAEEIGHIWSKVMQHVYNLGGLYTLNLHPERAVLCERALDMLLSYASSHQPSVWVTSLGNVARWWKERDQFRLNIVPLAPDRWLIEADSTPRATLLARQAIVEYPFTTSRFGTEVRIHVQRCIVNASRCPCIGLSSRTPQQVVDFLYEQGYPVVRSSGEEAHGYALFLDMPEGLGTTREEQVARRGALVQQIEQLEVPLIHFGCWPDGNQAALAITGDIDSVTIQDFFLRVFEVGQRSKRRDELNGH
jgi:peptidoglycan/xylan/chitin deacetylase (PgdA/CDA1 family)